MTVHDKNHPHKEDDIEVEYIMAMSGKATRIYILPVIEMSTTAHC